MSAEDSEAGDDTARNIKVETEDSDDDNNLIHDEKSSLQVETKLSKMKPDLARDTQDPAEADVYFTSISEAAKGDCMTYYKKAMQFS